MHKKIKKLHVSIFKQNFFQYYFVIVFINIYSFIYLFILLLYLLIYIHTYSIKVDKYLDTAMCLHFTYKMRFVDTPAQCTSTSFLFPLDSLSSQER
jgi:hypothetical protein